MTEIDLYDDTLEQKILELPFSNQVNLVNGNYIFIPESDYGFAEICRVYDCILVFLIPTYGGTPYLYKSYIRSCVNNLVKELRKMT